MRPLFGGLHASLEAFSVKVEPAPVLARFSRRRAKTSAVAKPRKARTVFHAGFK
jgi:hypothetical protein